MKKIKLLLILLIVFNQANAQGDNSRKEYSMIHFMTGGSMSKYYMDPSFLMRVQIGNTVVVDLNSWMKINYKIFSTGKVSIITTTTGSKMNQIVKQLYLNIESGKEYYLVSMGAELKEADSIEFNKFYVDKRSKYSEINLQEDIEKPVGEIQEPSIGPKSGTAFMINNQGYLVTNYHVIENAKKVVVKGLGGDFTTDYSVEVVFTDQNNDLAILKIKNQMLKFDSVPFRFKAQQAEQGESVFTLGYPLTGAMGEEIKVTDGIVSSKTGYKGSSSMYQLSVPIQPGNSGSPLFDANGNLIGIMNAVLKDAENASYAIKVNYLKVLMEMNGIAEASSKGSNLQSKTLPVKITELKKFIFIVTAE